MLEKGVKPLKSLLTIGVATAGRRGYTVLSTVTQLYSSQATQLYRYLPGRRVSRHIICGIHVITVPYDYWIFRLGRRAVPN